MLVSLKLRSSWDKVSSLNCAEGLLTKTPQHPGDFGGLMVLIPTLSCIGSLPIKEFHEQGVLLLTLLDAGFQKVLIWDGGGLP